MFGLDKPKVLEEVESKFSGKLTVMEGYGHKYVVTGIWTQSGGIIEDIWKPVLKALRAQHEVHNKTWLILGLATGTVAKIIAKKYKPVKIVGVEIDPAMLRIGKKYFDLDKIPNLEVINLDASKYKSNIIFDYVLVDIYQGDQLPEFIYGDKFLNNKFAKVAVFNHLFYSDSQKENAQKLVQSLKNIYTNVKLMRVLTNLMIICA